MPVVTRADCTQVDLATNQKVLFSFVKGEGFSATARNVKVEFNECIGVDGNDNDLASHYELLVEQGVATEDELAKLEETVVGHGNCHTAIQNFMNTVDI